MAKQTNKQTNKQRNPFHILGLALFDVDYQHYLAVNKRAQRKSNLKSTLHSVRGVQCDSSSNNSRIGKKNRFDSQ